MNKVIEVKTETTLTTSNNVEFISTDTMLFETIASATEQYNYLLNKFEECNQHDISEKHRFAYGKDKKGKEMKINLISKSIFK
jgi:hypothetical protein